jgi:hypothetical protein
MVMMLGKIMEHSLCDREAMTLVMLLKGFWD